MATLASAGVAHVASDLEDLGILLPVSPLGAMETVVQEDPLLGCRQMFASCVSTSSTSRHREYSGMNPDPPFRCRSVLASPYPAFTCRELSGCISGGIEKKVITGSCLANCH